MNVVKSLTGCDRTNNVTAFRVFGVAGDTIIPVFRLALLPLLTTVHIKSNSKLTDLPSGGPNSAFVCFFSNYGAIKVLYVAYLYCICYDIVHVI